MGIDVTKAQRIADRLFVNGAGERAARLVLVDAQRRDLGGWSFAAVVDQIEQVLTARRLPIRERIRLAMRGRLRAPYWELMRDVFPPSQYPKAWRHSGNGGPPGCSMAFNAAIRRLGGGWRGMGSDRAVWFHRRIAER